VGISLITEPHATSEKVTGLNLCELMLNWKHSGDYPMAPCLMAGRMKGLAAGLELREASKMKKWK